jgi:Zn-dependent protease with chaperone function
VHDPSVPEAGAPCQLWLTGELLVARLEDGRELAVPLEQLVYVRQGFDRDVHAFHARGALQPWLSTRDASLAAALRAHPAGAAALQAHEAGQRRAGVRHTLLPVLALALLVGGAVWCVAGPLLGLALRSIPLSVDVQLGKAALAPSLAQLGATEVHAPAVVEPVRRMLAPLVAQAPAELRAQLAFEVHVVRHDMVNAFALPGGVLVVTTGLLEKAPSAEAVTGVLAHEVAHVLGRHSLRSLLKQVGLWGLLAAALGDAGSATGLLLEQAAALTQLSFSRDMELEADREGLALLRRAGLDAGGLRAFLASLREEEQRQGDAVPAFLRTHPLTEERIALLERLAAEAAPSEQPAAQGRVDVDLAAVRAALDAGAAGPGVPDAGEPGAGEPGAGVPDGGVPGAGVPGR